MMNPENDRYAGLKAFIAEWFRPLEPGDGCTEEEIAAAETRLGFRLPAALREWYLLAGRCREITQIQDRLILPEDLTVEDRFLRFWYENQVVVSFAVAKGDLSNDDPVINQIEFYTNGKNKAFSLNVPFTAFLPGMVRYQLVMAALFVGSAEDVQVAAEIRSQFALLPGAEWMDSRFYQTDSVLAMVSGEAST